MHFSSIITLHKYEQICITYDICIFYVNIYKIYTRMSQGLSSEWETPPWTSSSKSVYYPERYHPNVSDKSLAINAEENLAVRG